MHKRNKKNSTFYPPIPLGKEEGVGVRPSSSEDSGAGRGPAGGTRVCVRDETSLELQSGVSLTRRAVATVTGSSDASLPPPASSWSDHRRWPWRQRLRTPYTDLTALTHSLPSQIVLPEKSIACVIDHSSLHLFICSAGEMMPDVLAMCVGANYMWSGRYILYYNLCGQRCSSNGNGLAKFCRC